MSTHGMYNRMVRAEARRHEKGERLAASYADRLVADIPDDYADRFSYWQRYRLEFYYDNGDRSPELISQIAAVEQALAATALSAAELVEVDNAGSLPYRYVPLGQIPVSYAQKS